MSAKTATKKVTKKETLKVEKTNEQHAKEQQVTSDNNQSTNPVKKGGVKKSVVKKVVEPAVEPAVESVVEPVVEPAKTTTKKAQSTKTAKTVKTVKTVKTAKTAKTVKTVKTAKKSQLPKKVNVKKVVPEVEDTTAEDEENSKTRFFKVIVDGGEAHGRFSGTKPKQAANKALTSIFKTKKQSGGSITGKIRFSIVECTRNSKHKQYNYVGERLHLDNQVDVPICCQKCEYCESVPKKVKGDTAVYPKNYFKKDHEKCENSKTIPYKFNNRVMKDKEVVAQA